MFNESFKSVEIHNDKIISHERLEKLFESNRKFFGSPKAVDFLLDNYNNFKKLFTEKPYFLGLAGLGYPFYNIEYLGTESILEFEDYGYKQGLKLFQDKNLNPEGFICAKCQTINSLPDFKKYCGDCKLSTLKPRDIFKLLPDIDSLLVVPKLDDLVKLDIEETVKISGFNQSDVDILDAIRRSEGAFDQFEMKSEEAFSFPVDLHVVEKQELIRALKDLQAGNEKAVLNTRALWSDWVESDLPFLLDFTFSLTFTNIKDKEIENEIERTWGYIKSKYSLKEFLDKISEIDPKTVRKLKEKTIMENLIKRYEK